jgi:hypothetical protein
MKHLILTAPLFLFQLAACESMECSGSDASESVVACGEDFDAQPGDACDSELDLGCTVPGGDSYACVDDMWMYTVHSPGEDGCG